MNFTLVSLFLQGEQGARDCLLSRIKIGSIPIGEANYVRVVQWENTSSTR